MGCTESDSAVTPAPGKLKMELRKIEQKGVNSSIRQGHRKIQGLFDCP